MDNHARDKRRGFGLGLAIVERTARLLGRRIGLNSVPGRGTAFSVNVPLAAPTQQTAGETRHGMSGDEISGAFIVVIEDEPDVLIALETLLEAYGCTVLAVAAGEQAAARLHNFATPPGAIIADYRLGGGELGTDAIRSVQQASGGGVPGILLTGDTSPERIREARTSGFRLMHKPVRTAVLKTLLAEILGSAASHRKPGNRPGVL